jgi:enoyl-CoA hydratase/carnithine racemase
MAVKVEDDWDPYDAIEALENKDSGAYLQAAADDPDSVETFDKFIRWFQTHGFDGAPDRPDLKNYDVASLQRLFLQFQLFRTSGAPWKKVANVTPRLDWYDPTCTADDWRHQDVKLRLSEGIAYVVLNRPAQNNTLNGTIMHGLMDAVFAIHARPDIRVVVFMAEGKIFSAGLDPNVMKHLRSGTKPSSGDGSEGSNPVPKKEQSKATLAVLETIGQQALKTGAFPDGKIDYEQLCEALFWQTMTRLPQVSMALVEGSVMSTGLNIIACVDLTISLKSVYFCMEDLQYGLVPAIMMPHLCQKLGPSNARFVVLSGSSVNAQDAKDLNLVQEVKNDSTEAHAMIAEICEFITKCGPKSVATCKQLVNGVSGNPITEKIMFYTAKVLQHVTTSEEAGVSMKCLQARESKPWEKTPIKPLF